MAKETRFPVLLRGAWFGMNKAFRDRIYDLGLTTPQYTILRCMIENEGVTQDGLAQLISTNKNNVSSLVKRMLSSGLIAKSSRAGDRRSFLLRVSPKGKRIFSQAVEIADQLRGEVTDQLSPGNEDELAGLLEKCTSSLSKK